MNRRGRSMASNRRCRKSRGLISLQTLRCRHFPPTSIRCPPLSVDGSHPHPPHLCAARSHTPPALAPLSPLSAGCGRPHRRNGRGLVERDLRERGRDTWLGICSLRVGGRLGSDSVYIYTVYVYIYIYISCVCMYILYVCHVPESQRLYNKKGLESLGHLKGNILYVTGPSLGQNISLSTSRDVA